jgi:hypothetical protein
VSADDDLLLVTDRDLERVIKPAKRWRNRWWRTGDEFYCLTCERMERGGEILGCRVYPSKDIAEEFAAQLMARPENVADFASGADKYLGAEPAP